MGARRGTISERLWRHVQKTKSCWLWTGSRNEDGYGRIKTASGSLALVHRVVFVDAFGQIDSTVCVCHHCDVRHCVRPEHLFAGSQQDNMRDAFEKGRRARGIEHGHCRFTEADVVRIMEADRSGVAVTALAQRFDVAFNSIWQIVHRKTWKHVI